MPKILSYTPAWLSSPSSGHEIFTPPGGSTLSASSNAENATVPGPNKTIARRGAEVFVAVGKEIRWTDLVYVKEQHEATQDRAFRRTANGTADDGNDALECYRTIKTNVADDIRQLVMSPHGDYLAILTKHTVHIAIIPSASHLTGPDRSPLRLKTYTLGPTTHVTSQSAVASALWHPLGVNGTCLVTITEEAVVRVWELSTTDRWSFDRPALVIDLKKLADGTSLDQDFSASKFGSSKTFSPDTIEMQVASACFGGRGSGGWSPMTLWIAMREGDVYALCPLLPEKWAPPSTLIPSLSVSIVANVAMMENDSDYSEETKRLSHQQLAWMADLDNQEPAYAEGTVGGGAAEVYHRPQKPGRIPKLQGPFKFDSAPEDSDNSLNDLLTDIHVIGSKIDADALMAGEDEDSVIDDMDQEGLSLNIVCLLASSGRVSVCLDLDGVEAQWLPNRKSKQTTPVEQSAPPSLLTYQVLETLRQGEMSENNWPMFSSDVASRYSFFVTNSSNVTFISLSPWVYRLESELQNGPEQGIDFRLDVMVKGENFSRERLISEDPHRTEQEQGLAACLSIRDPDLGYFLLTNSYRGPISLTMANPDDDFNIGKLISKPTLPEPDMDEQPLLLYGPRPVYEPSPEFKLSSGLPVFHEDLRRGKSRRLLHEPIRLSPATLTIFMDVHKILSQETHRIGTAAAELFRRCEQLQTDLQEQIAKANEVANRVEQVIGEDNDIDGSYVGVTQGIEDRIEIAKERQHDLVERLEKLRKKAAKGSGRELSDREKAWFGEVSKFNDSISKADDAKENKRDGSRRVELRRRFEEVRRLKDDILERVGELSQKVTTPASEEAGGEIPSELRREKVAQVMQLIERETALVEGARGRLQKLSLA